MIRFRHFALIFLLPLITGCASGSKARSVSEVDSGQVGDRSCSYFYFLWGTHAEYHQHFDEALDAYQKALICDEKATYIEKKIPVLLFRLGETEKAAGMLKVQIEKDPKDITQYLLLAHLAILQNKRDEAIKVYREALKHDPDNESVHLRLAILLIQQDRLEEGEAIFRNLITKNPEQYLPWVYLARLLQMKGDNDAAAAAYQEALRLNWSPELVFEIVEFYSAMERHDEVLRLYDSVLAIDATNERAIIGKIQTLLAMNRDEEALVELRKLRESGGNVDRLDMAISKTLLRLGKIDEAKAILEGLRRGEVESEANYLLGLITFQNKHMDKALGYFQAVLADSTEYPDAVYLQVRILRDFNRYDRAFTLLQKATSNPTGRNPLFYALLSSLYQEKDRMEEAMAALTAGTVVFPKSEQLHFEHALLLERSGLRKQALDAMQRVLEISPDNPEALNYIGYTWAEQNINLDLAKKYIQRAVELKPDNGFIRDSLGWVEFRLGNYDDALKELEQALDLEPNDPHIFRHLGEVYRALKRPADALRAYQKSLELFDDETDKANIRKILNELKAN